MQIITKSGLRLHYDAEGSGPVIILLHPVGLRGAFWKPVVDLLSGRFRLIYPDLRGHGRSDAPEGPFSLQDMAEDIVDLIRAECALPAIVCGCSLGGMLAQSIAISHSDLVKGLVVASAGFRRDAESRMAVLARAAQARAGMSGIADSTIERWFTDEVEQSDPTMVGAVRAWLLADDASVHAYCWEAMADLDNEGQLPNISVPTCAIAATGDQSVAPATLKDFISRIPGARYREIEGAGHLSPLERPKYFATILGEFAQETA